MPYSRDFDKDPILVAGGDEVTIFLERFDLFLSLFFSWVCSVELYSGSGQMVFILRSRMLFVFPFDNLIIYCNNPNKIADEF